MKFLQNILSNLEKKTLKSGIFNTRGVKGAFFALLALGLSSCFVNEDFSDAITPDDDSIVIQFAIPDLQSILTRATDKEIMINDLVALVFLQSSDGSRLIASRTFDSSQIHDNTISLNIGGEARDRDVIIYLFANPDDVDEVKNLGSIEAIRKYGLRSPIDLDAGLPMIGWTRVNTSSSNVSMSLYRSVAKVSVSTKVAGASLKGIQLFHNALSGYYSSPINTEGDYKDYVFKDNNSDVPASFNAENVVYTHPSVGFRYGEDDEAPGAFAVVGVERSSSIQYYRINFRTEKETSTIEEDEDQELEYLDLLANHHYQIEITGFLTNGYSSPAEAAEHPESDQYITYKIHDHSAEVYSMVTDGSREFGVTSEVALATFDEEGTVVIKCYDAINPEIEIQHTEIRRVDEESSEWLEWAYIGTHVDSPADFDEAWDKDNHGTQFEFKVSIKSDANLYEDEEGKLTLEWKGLKRTIRVTYESTYPLSQVCDAVLTIKKDGTEIFSKISDYWAFLYNEGTSVEKYPSGQVPHLYGIQPEDMTGSKKRINGFHFPMPYGNESPWTYEYDVDFSEIISLNGKESISDISVKVNSDTENSDIFNDETIEWTHSGAKGSLSFIGNKNSYKYAGASLLFIITYSDGSTSTVSASLYHTGFFHYEGDHAQIEGTDYFYVPETGSEDDRGYYYYEVVPMGDGFWLDRNIGAKANVSFIDINDDRSSEARKAAGRHYSITKKRGQFELPDFDYNMCPPGYHIPNQTEWDALRLSSEFETRSVVYYNTTYMSTYYKCGGKIGNIYLQKTRFVNQNNLFTDRETFSMSPDNGDVGAGYYWSVTEAPAMEKEQMGNWVRALYLNGASSAYVNASLTDHRMPVRCKAGIPASATSTSEHFLSFNVHQVTHVYLFDASHETPTPLYTFPGKAVGTTASAIQWQHFYCSTTVNPENVRMIFVKLEKEGKVTVYRRNGSSFVATENYSPTFLNEDNSWPYEKGKYYDFCDIGQGRDNNISEKQPSGCDTEDESDFNTIDFELEYPEEEVLLLKKTLSFESWSSNTEKYTKNAYDWTQVKVNAVLKVYTMVNGGSYDLQIFDGQWGQFADIGGSNSDKYHSSIKDRDIRVVTLTITNEIMQKLREHEGIILQGNNCIFLGMSYVQGDTEYQEPEKVELKPEYDDPDKESVVWEGEKSVPTWGQNWQEQSAGRINWSQFKNGDELRIYTIKSGGEFILQTFYDKDGWQDFAAKEYRNTTDINGFDVVKITLNDDLLNKLRTSNGLVIQGTNFILYGVTVVKN